MEEAAQTSRLSFFLKTAQPATAKESAPIRILVVPVKGQGRFLVAQPSKKCPRCGGSGKPEPGSSWCVEYCVICRGTGWIWTEFHLDESSLRDAASALLNSGRIARSTTGEGEKEAPAKS